MKHCSVIYFSLTFLLVFLVFAPIFTALSYGQSGCEQSDWDSPLERELNVTRPFNPNHPSDPHYGTDYAANEGDNVLSVADGKIVKKGYQFDKKTKSGWGEYVVIEHADMSTTLYAHLVKNSTNHLSKEQPVTKGQIIGNADATGGVRGPTGNHLHLEYTLDGQWWRKQSKRDPQPCIVSCPSEQPLTLSGPDAPSDGSQYTASGGTEPYIWSITKGSINSSNGIVTVSDQCGTATVTVTDKCENQASKEVRMPVGTWTLDALISYPMPCKMQTAPDTWSSISASGFKSCNIISGDSMIVYNYYTTASTMLLDPTHGDCVRGPVPCDGGALFQMEMITYSWRCQ